MLEVRRKHRTRNDAGPIAQPGPKANCLTCGLTYPVSQLPAEAWGDGRMLGRVCDGCRLLGESAMRSGLRDRAHKIEAILRECKLGPDQVRLFEGRAALFRRLAEEPISLRT